LKNTHNALYGEAVETAPGRDAMPRRKKFAERTQTSLKIQGFSQKRSQKQSQIEAIRRGLDMITS
jgi:hypothetical protein